MIVAKLTVLCNSCKDVEMFIPLSGNDLGGFSERINVERLQKHLTAENWQYVDGQCICPKCKK